MKLLILLCAFAFLGCHAAVRPAAPLQLGPDRASSVAMSVARPGLEPTAEATSPSEDVSILVPSSACSLSAARGACGLR